MEPFLCLDDTEHLIRWQDGHKSRMILLLQLFQAELEQFITTNACLTPREAAKFFPVYRQMGKKMRMIFDEMRRFRHVNPNDNEACAEAIRRQDELDIQLKQLQQEYHSRFMTILPPNKVFSVIKAEERFHRQAFRRMKK
jgi:hypothetical protein